MRPLLIPNSCLSRVAAIAPLTLSITLASLPNRVGSTVGSAIAQDPPPSIDIPFNADSDQSSLLPSDLEQVDSPLGDNSRVVIGEDERFPVISRQYPWSTMGRLAWQYQGQIVSTCTATLVGPSAILTNSHCLVFPIADEQSDQGYREVFVDASMYESWQTVGRESVNAEVPKLTFSPGMIGGVSLDMSDIVTFESGWSSSYFEDMDDWAVLTLAQPLGETYGYLGWRGDLDFTDEAVIAATADKVGLLGYAGDFPTVALREHGQPTETAGVDVACSILGIWPEDGSFYPGTLAHDCDSNPGASGGPIFGLFADNQYYIVGLHARSTLIGQPTRLPNGVVTNVVNGGVTVDRWSGAVDNSRR